MDNNNNNNTTTNMMMNKSNINGNNNKSNIPTRTMEPNSNSGSPRHAPEAASAFYRIAAQNLREFYGVKSMTVSSLEKTMILLHLAPRRLVVLGLAPRRLLKETLLSPTHAPEYRSHGDEGALTEGSIVSHEDNNLDNTEEEMDADAGQEEEASDDDVNTVAAEKKTEEKKETEPRLPIHAALVAGGVQVRPREVKTLLRALNVSPHRFVRLGLVDHEVLRLMHEGNAYHSFPRQRSLGRPYGRVPSMGKPRRSPPHGPPHGAHHRRGHLHYGPWFGGGIGHSRPLPLSRGHPGRHHHFLDSKTGGMHGRRRHSPPSSRSCSPTYRGPGRHGSPHGWHDTGGMRHSVSPHARGGLRSDQHPGLNELNVLMPGFGPWNLSDRPHHGHGHGRRTHHGRVPPPHGSFGRRRPFRSHLHGEGEADRDLMVHGQLPRECPRSLDVGYRGRVRGRGWVGSPPCGRHRCPVQSNRMRGGRGRFPEAGPFGRGPVRGGGGHFESRGELEAY